MEFLRVFLISEFKIFQRFLICLRYNETNTEVMNETNTEVMNGGNIRMFFTTILLNWFLERPRWMF